jgi:hypothetical protein
MIRAAKLLVEIGDARGRFPTTPASPRSPAPHPRPANPAATTS